MEYRPVYEIHRGYSIYKTNGGYIFTINNKIKFSQSIKEVRQYIDNFVETQYSILINNGTILRKQEFEDDGINLEEIEIIECNNVLYYIYKLNGFVCEISELWKG